ncbi:MAG: hypothetical protein FWE06_04535 [Oscillospiraceae bacterium]|nr:hypothetical protein [Oscillospiraceae bacterium]
MTFFLGSNTPDGFYSFYDQLIDLQAAQAVYILKGGPGCGKSTLIRAVAEMVGEQPQYIACGADPASMDAVCFPQRHVAVVDGTAPHERSANTHKNYYQGVTVPIITQRNVHFGLSHFFVDFLIKSLLIISSAASFSAFCNTLRIISIFLRRKQAPLENVRYSHAKIS